MLPFERSEYLERVARTQQRMEAAGIEVLLVSDPGNMNYLTGYDALSYYTPQLAVVALAAEEPLWVGRAMDVACARYTAFLRPENVIGYPESYIGVTDRHVMEFVADVLRERGWGRGRIGAEMDSFLYTARSHAELQRLLPEATFVDADLLVNWVRVVKSAAEIEYMRQAGLIADRGMQAGIEAIASGVRQCDVAARIYAALIEGTPEFGGDLPTVLTMPTGERASSPHLTWTDEPFRVGEATNIELGGCRYRYNMGLARTVCVGEPPAKLAELVPVVVEGMAAALDAAQAGALCQDVEAAWRRVLNQGGYEKESRIGYSIGIGYPGLSWVERTASLQQGDTTLLEPNMTFHMILGMWMDDWGFELSEVFRVSEDGAPETFSAMPRQLFVKD